IETLRGAGRRDGERVVTVDRADGVAPGGGRIAVRARQAVVVATGSTATRPPTPGLAEAGPWTSRDGTAMIAVPASVAVIGGGVVVGEAATWLASLSAGGPIVLRGVGLS